MDLNIVLLVLVSATIHPVWNLLVKKNPDPELGFIILIATIASCALIHSLWVDADFYLVIEVFPMIVLSVFGLLLYGMCLTQTLKRGDLSAYYPIIRASPVFVVIVSVILLGNRYPLVILLGIAMTVLGGYLILYRRGASILEDPRTLGLALLAMSGTGIYSIADAQLMQTLAPSVSMFFVDGLLLSIYATIWYRRTDNKLVLSTRLREISTLYMLIPGVLAYASYFMILQAYKLGGDVAAVTAIRQASIPISVLLGGMFLQEGSMLQRFLAAGLLGLGIVVIALSG